MVAKHICGKGVITPKLAPDDDVGLRDPLDQTDPRVRPRARTSCLDRQAAMLRSDMQMDRNHGAIRTADLGGFSSCWRAPRKVPQEKQPPPLNCKHTLDGQQLSQDVAWLTPLTLSASAAAALAGFKVLLGGILSEVPQSVHGGARQGSPLVQPGTWVTLLSGHMGNTRHGLEEGARTRSAWFGGSCNPRSEAKRNAGCPEPRGARGGDHRCRPRAEVASSHAAPCPGTWVTPDSRGTIVRDRSCRTPR